MSRLAPSFAACSDTTLAMFGEVIHARIDNADRMLEIAGDVVARGGKPLPILQTMIYLHDWYDGLFMLDHLHAEYERRIGELCNI